MQNILSGALIVIGIVIIVLTLFQGKGGGLGSAWGGAGSFQTRRGLEKWLLRITSIMIFIFFILSFINLLI